MVDKFSVTNRSKENIKEVPVITTLFYPKSKILILLTILVLKICSAGDVCEVKLTAKVILFFYSECYTSINR